MLFSTAGRAMFTSHTWHSLLSLMQVICLSNDCAVHSSTIRGSNIYMKKGINSAAHLAAVANITPKVIIDKSISLYINHIFNNRNPILIQQ